MQYAEEGVHPRGKLLKGKMVMAKSKTYHRRVFGGKDAVWLGMDQGKGLLYRGNTVRFSLNATFEENTFRPREGQTASAESYEGSLHTGRELLNTVVVGAGTDFYVTEKE